VRALDTARTYKERGHEAWVLYLQGEIAGRDDSPDPPRRRDGTFGRWRWLRSSVCGR